MNIKKALMIGLMAAFASTSVACGPIVADMTLALEGENNSITLWAPKLNLLQTTNLEGGLATTMEVDISIWDLLFHIPVNAPIEINDLLFAGTPMVILGISTQEVCAIQDPNNLGGGVAVVDIFGGNIQFDMSLGTLIKIGNPVLSQNLPGGGFTFDQTMSASIDMSLSEMLGMFLGTGEGITITQAFNESIFITIPPIPPIPATISGSLTLASADAIPITPLVQGCLDFLAE